MRKTTTISTTLILSLLLGGCIVVSSNKTQSDPKKCGASPQASTTIAEIDAAGKLHTESAKQEIYEAIAKRPNLTEQERIYLIEAAQKKLHTESARKQVLMILVNNHPQMAQPPLKEESVADDETATE